MILLPLDRQTLSPRQNLRPALNSWRPALPLGLPWIETSVTGDPWKTRIHSIITLAISRAPDSLEYSMDTRGNLRQSGAVRIYTRYDV
jgi:hypothetical protein